MDMKYLIFYGVVLCLPALVFLLLLDRRLIRWVLLVGMLLPVACFNATAINFFSHETYRGTSRGMEISIIYLAAIVLVVVFFILRGRVHLAPDWGIRFYLLYFLLGLPSLFHSANRLFSWFELWKMMMIYLVFLAVYGYLEYSRGDFSVFLTGMTLLALFNFLVIVQQHFQGVYQVPGMLPHRNSMAMFMSLFGVLLFARYFNQTMLYGRWLFLLGFCVAAFAVFRSYSRGAAVCFTLGLLISLGCSLWVSFSPRKVELLGILAVLGAIGMIYLLPRLMERFDKVNEASFATRIRLAEAAVKMIEDEPLSGVGLNNWGIKINPPYTYSERREERAGASDEWEDGIVETIYLLVGAECGIPCLVALLLWFGYYLVVCLRLLWRLRATRYFFLPVGLLGGLIAVYLQSILEWVLKQQVNFIWLMIFFAMLSYLNRNWRGLLESDDEYTLPREGAMVPKPEDEKYQGSDAA